MTRQEPGGPKIGKIICADAAPASGSDFVLRPLPSPAFDDKPSKLSGGVSPGNCATGCATEFAFFAASTRQQIYRANEKPADLAGFSVKSLVALPGIEPGFED